MPPRLDDTSITRWHHRLATDRRGHWQTKTAYYRAVRDLVESSGTPLSWRAIVAAVKPQGSRSTFYEVAGGRARHSLIRHLVDEGSLTSLQITLCYRRLDAVEQLLDETKVWTFWAYREALLREWAAGTVGEEAMAEALTRAVSQWARRYPRLALTLGAAPPACAVEDLVVLRQGRLSAVRAADLLGRAVRDGARQEPPRTGPGGSPVRCDPRA